MRGLISRAPNRGDYDLLCDLDGPHCIYCGGSPQVVDHVVPVILGGPNYLDNLVLSCRSCNALKSGALDEEWLARGFFVVQKRGGSLQWLDKLQPYRRQASRPRCS
jgi:hypothetical protein